VCTGYSENLDSSKARESGINAFLMKPVERRVLARTVRRVLDEGRASFEPPQAVLIHPKTASRQKKACAPAPRCAAAGSDACD
jgi:response regulator RpfG family c-di-GMP phosphodiesterase